MATPPSEDVWNSYKELRSTVWNYLNQKSKSELPATDLENILIRHKPNFATLLQNPPKSTKKREELKNATVDGIYVRGVGHQVISQELYQEAIILSDMYDMNELVALDLLCTAQLQMPYYPGLGRGLVAILLYYDGRKSLLISLLYLVQARTGIQWDNGLKPEISRFITDYTNQLLDGGLCNRILDSLRSLDLTAEINKLQENLALGGAKHRREITDLFNDIRTTLANIVFSWSIQSGLNKKCTLALMDYLKQCKLDTEASGIIDDVTLFLQMALISAFDLSIFHTREDGEEVVQSLPILSDTTLITALVSDLLPSNPKWVSEGLQAFTTFAMSVTLASLRVLPQNYIFQDSINKEDILADFAIEMNVFSFLHNIILENKTLYKEQYLNKRMHNLITDFVVYMYPKAKDLRMKANEVSRTLQVYIREGLEGPPNLPRYFEYLLLSIGKFYSNNSQNHDLALMWWSPIEIKPNQSSNIRVPPRTVALFKFIKLAGEMLPASLFVPVIKMLSGLSSTTETAKRCFNMLKQPGTVLSQTVSWEHFFISFGQYYTNLRTETSVPVDTMYRIRSNYHKGVSPQELEGLHAVLLIIRTVSLHDSVARLAFCEHPIWTALNILLGLVSCSVPILLKADILQTLAVLCKSVSNASKMWVSLETSQIIVTIRTTSSYAPRGIQTELDEIESRMEEYPLTRAVLQLLDNLTTFGIPKTLGAGKRKPGFDPYLHFIMNCVFLKYNSRCYRDPAERYEVALICLKLFDKFLKHYTPKLSDFPKRGRLHTNSPPGYHLMVQFNNKTEALSLILELLDEGIQMFESYVPFHGQEILQKCTYTCLTIILKTLSLQPKFVGVLASTSSSVILTNVSKLLMSINRRTGRPDHCLNIAKFMGLQQYLPQHPLVAVRIILYITSTPTGHNNFMTILSSSENVQDSIKNGFFQCLDSRSDDVITNSAKYEIIHLLRKCLEYPAPNLSHFLLGFDLKRDVSKTEFQYPGILGFPRTCLHSVLSILDCVVTKKSNLPSVLLTEPSYHLIYLLAADPKTGGPILRFIRSNKQFFPLHLKHCRATMTKDARHLKQMSWLMKTLACELWTASNTKLITYLRYLISFLGNVSNNEQHQESMFLHQILNIELSNLKGVPRESSLAPIATRNQKRLKLRAMRIKKYRESCNAVIEFADAWRQVAEVIVTFTSLDVLDVKEQQEFGIYLLQYLLKRVVRSELLPPVSRLLSGSALLIVNNIKRNYLQEKRRLNVLPYYLGSLKEILNYLVQWIMISDVVDGELRINLYAALVSFLQLTSNIELEPKDELSPASGATYVAILDSSRSAINKKGDTQTSVDFTLLNAYGEKFMEILCNDLIGSQEVCKVLAMTSFSHLMMLTGDSSWQTYLSGHGFLKHLIQSIMDSNDELRSILEPGCESAKILYLYVARVMLIIRLAGTPLGAQMILEEGLLTVFSSMSVFSCHPEISKVWQPEGDKFQPSHDLLYLQLFTPVLEVCNAILTTLGTENQSAISQITYFLISQMNVIELVLRSGDTSLSLPYLRELALLTSVISRIANNDLINIMENPNLVVSNRRHLYRIQRLMLNLIPKFILSEESIKKLLAHPTTDKMSFQTSDRLIYGLQIAANLVWYPRNVIANNDIEHEEVGVIFYPSLYDPQLHVMQSHSIGYINEQEPSLGSIVQQLLHTVNHVHQAKVTLDLLTRKLNEIPDMNSLELKIFLDDDMEILDLDVKRERAYEVSLEKLSKKKKEIDYCIFIIENALFIIWAHLDYFLLKAIPNPRSTTYIHPATGSTNLEVSLPSGQSEAISKVSTEVISNLRQGLVSLFNDSFSNQLLETSQGRSEQDKGLTDALLRKIKRLVQFVRVR